jgi:hypothetical protein
MNTAITRPIRIDGATQMGRSRIEFTADVTDITLILQLGREI